MRLPPVVLAVSLSILVFAGCLDDSSDGGPDLTGIPSVTPTRLADPGKEAEYASVIVGDHGAPNMHTIRGLHGGGDFLKQVGWNALTDKLPPGAVGTGWGAAGLWHEYACVAQFAGTGAIAIVDISDPANLVVTAQVDDPLVNGDCQFTQDGNYLLAGAYLGPGPNPAIGEGGFACPRGCPGGGGINVWDVSDKAAPRHILYENTGEYHTLHLWTTEANETYVVQAYSGNVYRFEPDTPALTKVFKLTPMDHDMWISKHPITGEVLLYTGFGDGFVIYNFDDPTFPRLLSAWVPEDDPVVTEEDNRGGCCGWHRQATVDQLVDGKAIAVVAGEACGAGYTLPYYVMDVTDPAAPYALSRWEVPGKPVSTDAEHLCEMSPHEFAVYDGYVITGNYHAGVWLFDLGSAERLMDPVTLGYFIPAEEPATAEGPLGAQDLTFPWNPFVWGAFFDDRGYVLAGDFSSGVYLLEVPGVTQTA
ncbi:MAG: LVIVD repeat-containing protein [Thermoplasmatota archaeon]